MKLGLIYARSRNGVIGKDGALPWRLPEDMAHFKALTMGCPVLMGRRTWDSVPPKFRPLPGRRNIVITRNADWSAHGAERAGSLEEAIALCEAEPLAWVTGGTEVFQRAMPLADRLELTEIDADFEGDALAPEIGPGWTELAREQHVSAGGLRFAFVTYGRDILRD